LSLFRYFDVGLRVCDIVVKTPQRTFAVSTESTRSLRLARHWACVCKAYPLVIQ